MFDLDYDPRQYYVEPKKRAISRQLAAEICPLGIANTLRYWGTFKSDQEAKLKAVYLKRGSSRLRRFVATMFNQDYALTESSAAMWVSTAIKNRYPQPFNVNGEVFGYIGGPVMEAFRAHQRAVWLSGLIEHSPSLDEIPMNEQDFIELLRWVSH